MGNNKTCPYCSPDKKVMMPIIADDSDFFAIEITVPFPLAMMGQ